MKSLLSLTQTEHKALRERFKKEVKNKETQYTIFGSWYRNRKK